MAGADGAAAQAVAGAVPAAPVLEAAPVVPVVPAPTPAPRNDEDELRALVPDSAMAAPEAWARSTGVGDTPAQTVAPAPLSAEGAAAVPGGAPELAVPAALRPDSPLADMPDFAVDWPALAMALPDVPQLSAQDDPAAQAMRTAMGDLSESDGTRPARQATQVGRNVQLRWPDSQSREERMGIEIRFRQSSTLNTTPIREGDDLAQISVRAAADRALLLRLMRIYGYYDGEVIQNLSGGTNGAAISLRFDMLPADRFRLGAVDLGQIDAAGADAPALRAAFGLKSGDYLDSFRIVNAVTALDRALGQMGYPFAVTGKPALSVDHARAEGDLSLSVVPGGKYVYGPITSSSPRYLSGRHLQKIARFRPGQPWKREDVDDLRRAILATGLVANTAVTPKEITPPRDGQPGVVGLDIALTRAPRHTVSGEMGYDTGEGFRIGAAWEDRNLFPPEGSFRVRGVLGTEEQLAGITFKRSNFGGRDRVLTVDLFADNATLDAYAARKVAFAATYERQTTLLFQKPWTWSMGAEVQASEEREGVPSGITKGRTFYLTTALPLRGAFDGSNNLLDPARGHRAALRVSPEISWRDDQNHQYVRIQGDASWYQPLGDTMVLAMRARMGSLVGTQIDNVAPSRRFYAGGGGSIRGYGYELVGPRNALGEPKGGRSLYEFSIEARVNTGLFGGNLQLVPFLDMGGAETGVLPRFDDTRFGAGLGIRYRTNFGPIRIDLGTPLNPRSGDSRIGVYVALGQAF
ncbi:BamA/TamA family outer membrane protein [Novosphingobium sp. FSY-8]|uniref:BamA/TamA family outer membrane protein n=2 Tax=Novosphingobium ovatum TaxID=1908523 RepID=A0ABW9XE55_9SPHN|nr:BamA/TamA family outer membrane protein [Novosphingobium ovatum]